MTSYPDVIATLLHISANSSNNSAKKGQLGKIKGKYSKFSDAENAVVFTPDSPRENQIVFLIKKTRGSITLKYYDLNKYKKNIDKMSVMELMMEGMPEPTTNAYKFNGNKKISFNVPVKSQTPPAA